jgi:hypothetical protein
MAMDENFREPGGAARAATIALAVFIAVDIIFGLGEAYLIWAIDGFQANENGIDVLERSDTIGMITGIGFMLAYLGAAIFSGRWIYRVNKNARARNEGWMTISPGWNVGYLFVPFANLLLPFRGVRETMQVSADPQAPEAIEVPALLRLWWGAWLAMGVLGQISFRLLMGAETLEDYRFVAVCNFATTPVDVVGTVLFLRVIWRITRLQQENLGASGFTNAERTDPELERLAAG